LNADKDKVNELVSAVPYLDIAHTTTGEAPNQTKTATVSQDLSHFPLSGGELVTVEKSAEGLTLNDAKVKELIDTKAEALKKELGSGAGTGTGATASSITLNGGELVKVDKSGDTLTLNDSKVKELVESTKTEILKAIPPKKLIASQYDLEAEEVLNAEFGVEGEKLRYSTFILSLEYNGKYDSHFIHIPLNNNEVINKLSDNTIIRINPKAEGFHIMLYFKNATSITISGVDYCNLTDTPSMTINTLSETYDDVNNTLLPTSGNTPQPLDDGYGRL